MHTKEIQHHRDFAWTNHRRASLPNQSHLYFHISKNTKKHEGAVMTFENLSLCMNLGWSLRWHLTSHDSGIQQNSGCHPASSLHALLGYLDLLVGGMVAQRVIHCSRWNFVPFWGQQPEKHSKYPKKCLICLELFDLFKMEHVEQLNHCFGFDKHGDALTEASLNWPTQQNGNNHHEICFLYRAFSMRRISLQNATFLDFLVVF